MFVYIGFRSPNAEAWTIVRAGGARRPAGRAGRRRRRAAARRRAEARIEVHPGERDELAYLGWDVGESAGSRSRRRPRSAGPGSRSTTTRSLPTSAEWREVAAFIDPFGFRHELRYGLAAAAARSSPGRPISGFVTGDGGLGHVVLIVPDLDAGRAVLRRRVRLQGVRHRSTRASRSRSCTATRATTRWPSPAGTASSACTT